MAKYQLKGHKEQMGIKVEQHTGVVRGRGGFRESGWEKRLLVGDRATLARAISLLENGAPETRQVLRAIYPHTGRARVVGFTGAPGVGKSTLVGAFVAEMRGRGNTVAVVAVDPSSPISGGAILGDRIRMGAHGSDPGVFVRSLANRGHGGGLTSMTAHVVDLLDAAGFDAVVVETVGAGQSEVEIAEIAQTSVVVVAPGLGDEIQAHKAGILEIADILVVNKGDLPLAETALRQMRESLSLHRASGWQVPVLMTTAMEGKGLDELADAVERHAEFLRGRQGESGALDRMARLLARTAGRLAARRVQAMPRERLAPLLEQVLTGDMDVETAASAALADQEDLP